MTPPPVENDPRYLRDPLLWLSCAFAAGIAIGAFVDVHFLVSLSIALSAAAMSFLQQARPVALYPLIAAFLALGAFCHQFDFSTVPDHRVKRIYDTGRIASGTLVELEGSLAGRAEPAHEGATLKIRTDKLVRSDYAIYATGTVRVFIPISDPEQFADLDALRLASGTVVRVACPLIREDQYLNPGVTSRLTILDQQSVDATCTVKSPLLIEVLDRPAFPSPLDLVYEQRQWLIDEFRSRLSPQAAGVMIASLLGDKYFLDQETADVFRDGGTFHVLVISGLHITFIGGILLWTVGRFTRDRWWQLAIAGPALWLYALAVGAEAPVVRASVMFTVFLLSRAVYRNGSSLNTLGLCCLLLLAWRPADLFNPSFQLTIVSVAAIIGMAFPMIEKLRATGSWMPEAATPFPPNVPTWPRRFCETLYWRPHVWEIEQGRQIWSARIFKSPYVPGRITDGARKAAAYLFEGLLVSIVVQLWLLPLSIHYFHRVSPISIVLNIWVGIVITAQSFTAIFAVLFGRFSETLALPFALFTNFLNWLLLIVPALFTGPEWTSFRVPVYSGPMRLVYLLHLVLLVLLAAAAHRWDVFALTGRGGWIRSAAQASLALAGLSASLMVFHPLSAPILDRKLRVEFLDVGQGDSSLVTFHDGQTMLIDGGGRMNYSDDDEGPPFEPDVPRIGEMVVSEFLWEKGLSRVDRLVVSHADADHSQGLADVVRNFDVGEIWLGAMPNSGPELEELLAEANRNSVAVKQIGRGDNYEIAGTRVEILWPVKSNEQAGSDNNASLVIRLLFGEAEFLFTGDIEKETEAALVGSGTVLSADVVKVPHHGSRTSSTADFVNAVRPEIAVIPVGRRSMFGHPHPEVLQRWQASAPRVLTTGQIGTVTITTDGRSIELETFVK